jgi:hypothetical protein
MAADAKRMRRNTIRLLQERYVNTTAGYEDRAVLQPLLAFMHRVIGRTVAETQRRAPVIAGNEIGTNCFPLLGGTKFRSGEVRSRS